MPTTASGFYFADASTPMSAEDISAAEATAAQGVIDNLVTDNRQQQSYIWADAAARGAQTGMAAGDKGYQVDTAFDYYFDGALWNVVSGFSTFTPSWVNLTVGDGSQSWYYQISGGIVTVQGGFTMGTTSSMGSNPHFAPPIPGIFVNGQLLGASLYSDLSAGPTRFHGPLHYDSGIAAPLPRRFGVSGALISDTAITAASPFSWASGDVLSLSYQYRAA